MRKIMPLLLLLVTGCGDGDPADGTPKSRTNERGEIERHLRHIASDSPPARPFPTARRPTTEVLPDTAPGQEAPSEAARAQAISEAHVHEHEHVEEPEAQVAERAQVAQARSTEPTAEPQIAPTTVPEARATEARATEAQIATATPEASSAGPEEAPAPSDVELTRVVAARAITDREPVGTAPFSDDVEQLFLFVEARNDGAPATVAVRWIAPDGTRGRAVELQIPTSRRWRTWATTRRIHDRPGHWTAIVTDAAGRELGRSTFEVNALEASAAESV